MKRKTTSMCPKCNKSMEHDRENLSYNDFLKKWNEGGLTPIRSTLVESWGLGFDGSGNFFVDYFAKCELCGFEYSYTEHKGDMQ